MDQLVLHYLRTRGHKAAEKALLSVLEDSSESKLNPSSLSSAELAKQLAKFTTGASEAKPAEAPTLRGLVTSVGSVGAEELLASDPSDKHQGFRELEAWVDGSLDMYRVRH
jgi:transcription initiation factor TFIID subunit 5